MLMILSTWSRPADALVRARALLGAVQAVGHGLVEHLVDQRRLARAGHPGDRAERAQRDLGVHALEVVLGRALDLQVAGGTAALGGDRDLLLARQVLPGERPGDLLDHVHGALGHHGAAVLAGARAHVHDVVGRAHGALVVLDHDHGVAQVAQALQGGDQALVVALVQPDRGLVEDVQHAHQRRADLGGQPDPLRLTAREGRRGALQRQVAHAHVVQEAQPLVDLAQDQPRDRALGVGQLQLVEPLDRAPRAHRRQLVDAQPAQLHGQALGPQPRAVALRARAHRHVLLDLVPRPLGVGLAVAPLQVVHDALEAGHVAALAPVAVLVGDVDALAVGAVEERLAHVLVQVLPGRVQVHLPLVGDRLGHLLVVVRGAGGPRQDRPLRQRQRRVGHDQLGVDLHLRAQAGAARAGAVRGVEREDARLQLGHRGAAVQAGEALGEGLDLAGVHQLEVHQALGQADGGLDRVGQPLAQVRAHDQPVDHDRDVVLVALVEVELLLQAPAARR